MTIFLKKGIDYSFETMLKIGIQAEQKLHIEDLKNLKILMIYDNFVLFKLESYFIKNGIRFEWIEDLKISEKDRIIGIIANISKEYKYQNISEYQKSRNIIDLKNTYKFKELLDFINKEKNNE